MRKSIICIIIMLSLTSLTLAENKSLNYLQLNVIEGDTLKYLPETTRGGCYINPGEKCTGMIYKNDDGSGIFVGSIINTIRNSNFEMLYSFTYSYREFDTMLYGSIYNLQMLPDGKITSGEKTAVSQKIHFGEDYNIPAGYLPDGQVIALEVSVSAQKPEPDRTIIRSGPLSLISTFFKDGKSFSSMSETHGKLLDTNIIKTGYGLPKDSLLQQFQQLMYKIEVIIPGLPENIDEPFHTQLIYNRIYSIDTIYFNGDEFTEDIVYQSQYHKDIELSPGKMLQLIFPPDTPSVRGFDIEDTLVIVPQ